MERREDYLLSNNLIGSLAVLNAATVTVYLAGTVTKATLYSDNGVTPLTNPVTSDSNGNYAYYAQAGLYDEKIEKTGYTTAYRYGIRLAAPFKSVIATGETALSIASNGIDPWFHINSNGIGAVGNGVTVPYIVVESSPAFEINLIQSVNLSGQFAGIASTSATGLFPVFRTEAWGDLWLRAGKGATDLVDNNKQVRLMGSQGISMETFSGTVLMHVLPSGFVHHPVGAPVASGGTITPTGHIFHVTGTADIWVINLPVFWWTGSITLIPDDVFTTNTGSGVIAKSSTAIVGQPLVMTWDGAKWYPSY